MEEIDCEAFSRDVKFIEFSKEFRCPTTELPAEESRLFLRGFLEHGFQNFEGGMQSFTLLVEYQGPVFHAGSRKEGYITSAGELLRCPPSRIVLWTWETGRGYDYIEVICY